MYSRELKNAPDRLIKNGKALFGSYKTPPKTISIKGVHRPYGIFPFPAFITNLAIRNMCSFVFDCKEYLGSLDIIDLKFIGFIEVNIWDKNTNQRFSYRGVTGLHRHLIPKNIEKAICSTYRKNRYVRFAWDKSKNRFSLVFHMKGDNARPDFDGSFVAKYNNENAVTLVSVLPSPTKRRCYLSYQRVLNTVGGVFASKKDENLFFVPEDALCLYTTAKTYHKFRMQGDIATGIGRQDGKSIIFRLSVMNYFSENMNEYNENSFFVDNELTPLPPVVITHSYGTNNDWIIQDTEGMVDLTFTPFSTRQKFLSIVFFNARYNFVFGKFSGVIVSKDGKSYTLKDFTGVIKNLRLRI